MLAAAKPTDTKNKAKKEAMMDEMWKMKKLDIKKLQAAFEPAFSLRTG